MAYYNPYFALFNCHINDAEKKASEAYKKAFGERRFEKKIQPFLDKGIMSMFHEKPTRDIKFFVFYNWDVVNGLR